MNQYLTEIILFSLLLIFFLSLFWWVNESSILSKVFATTRNSLEMSRVRQFQNQRRDLLLQQERKGYVYHLEKRLLYSGISTRFPLLTPFVYLGLKIVVAAIVYCVAYMMGTGIFKAGLFAALFLFLWYLTENMRMLHNYNQTEECLIKFLDCLGNYSVTTSEITWILSQVSEYMEEPVKSVLEECCLEAQTTGDSSFALLYMAEKLQHPKFAELIRNLEISIRYSADLTIMVAQSKKTLGEYLRMRQERKSLTREAWVNILILGSMTLVILKAVEILLSVPMNRLLFSTIPGVLCVSCIVFILFLFYRKIRKMDV